MNDFMDAIILGVVQGLTEFLPVSSTGHLIISANLLGLAPSISLETFEVVIQLGSILAVVVLYFKRFIGLLLPDKNDPFSGPRGLFLLFLTSLPISVVGLLARSFIKENLFNPVSVSLALAVGAVFILLVEKFKPKERVKELGHITPALALGIGCFQCLALWPGFSRSTATIMGGLLLGARRSLAAEYSFIAAVPVMFAASSLDLYKSASFMTKDDLYFLGVGTFVAFVSALLAIKILIRLVARISFCPFAWYRLLIAPLVFYFFM